jgi:hypothetical protein
LKRAIEINPDAHFGREKYQILLIEYSLAQPQQESFADYIQVRNMTDQEVQTAVKGVLGIVRFGNHENPKVLEALGSLLVSHFRGSPESDAKALSTRAFLKASYSTKDSVLAAELRKAAEQAIHLQTGLTIETVEREFRRELDDANKWYEELRQRELGWIAAGVDVDAEFAKLYAQEPAVVQTRSEGNLPHKGHERRSIQRILAVLIGGTIIGFASIIGFLYLAVRRLWPTTFESSKKPTS